MRDHLPEDLQPFEGDLFRVVREGLDLFHQRHGAQRAGMSTRSERSLVHDCMAEMAQKIFPPHHWKRRGQLFLLVLGRYRIKLKKFDSRLVTSSYPTQAVFEFLAQRFHRLFDFDIENLQVGYVPAGLSVSDYTIWVTKPTASGRPEWEHELRPVAAVAPPILPVTDPNIAAKPRVKAKPAEFKKAEESND